MALGGARLSMPFWLLLRLLNFLAPRAPGPARGSLRPNGRGLRSGRFLPNSGPGFADAAGRGTNDIADGSCRRRVFCLVLLHADPRPLTRTADSGQRPSTARRSSSPSPSSSNPARRARRRNPPRRVVRRARGHGCAPRRAPSAACARPSPIPAMCARSGGARAILGKPATAPARSSAPMVSEQVFEAVPLRRANFDEIGAAASAGRSGTRPPSCRRLSFQPAVGRSSRSREPNGVLRSARARALDRKVTRHAPVLEFLKPEQTVELSPADAERLGVGIGCGRLALVRTERTVTRHRARTCLACPKAPRT